MTIESLDADATASAARARAAILKDSVDDGASVGFLPPLGDTAAMAYWGEVAEAVRAGARVARSTRPRSTTGCWSDGMIWGRFL